MDTSGRVACGVRKGEKLKPVVFFVIGGQKDAWEIGFISKICYFNHFIGAHRELSFLCDGDRKGCGP